MVNDLVKVVSKLLQHAHPLIHTHTTLPLLHYVCVQQFEQDYIKSGSATEGIN